MHAGWCRPDHIPALPARNIRLCYPRSQGQEAPQDDGQSESSLRPGQWGFSREILTTAIVRPSKMLICSPIIFLFSLYMFIVYGYLYLVFTALPTLFKSKYDFSTGSIGLTYLGLGVGSFAGVMASGATSDRLAHYMKTKAGGEPKPEYRLPLVVIGSFVVPAGLFWIGWTAESRQHWILPVIGTAILSLGVTLAFVSSKRVATFQPRPSRGSSQRSQMAILTYLIDAYDVYAASAVGSKHLPALYGGCTAAARGRPNVLSAGHWLGKLLAGLHCDCYDTKCRSSF